MKKSIKTTYMPLSPRYNCISKVYTAIGLFVTIFLITSSSTYAQIPIAATTAVTQNFDALANSATATLPANWRITPNGFTGTSVTWANATITTTAEQASAGSPTTGGVYNWGTAAGADRALGVMSSGTYTSPTNIMALYQNTNLSNLTSLSVSYKLERYRINTAAASVQFFYSLNGTTWVAIAAADIAAATIGVGANGYSFAPQATFNVSGASITGLNIPQNGNIYLRWQLSTTGANSQGIGIDDVSIVAGFAAPAIILSDNSLFGFTYMLGVGPSPSQSVTIRATNLNPAAGNITIAASANYEVSLNNTTFSQTSISLPYTGGSLPNTLVYIRLKAGLAINSYLGENIVCSGGGALNEKVLCNGLVTNFFSSNSDIIAVALSEPATISSTIINTPPLTIATGIQVWSLTIRDGGLSGDVDNLPTIVNSIIFSPSVGNAVSNWSQAIRTISLFDGATLIGTGTVTASQIQFNGLAAALTIPDNTSKTITVRLSLNCGIGGSNSDGDDFGFSITTANLVLGPSTSSSQKTTFAAVTSANARNIIDIVATKLLFSQQPQSSVAINANFSPAVTAIATDACGNIDKGYSGIINITSTGALISSPITAAASAGIASFSGIAHTVPGGPFTLTASAAGLTSIVSNSFSVTISTSLGSGDLMFVGFDSYVNSSADIYSIVNFVPLQPATSFTLGNIVYDVKAPANVRQDRWYNGNGTLSNDLAILKFTYNGTSNIAAGSITCISVDGGGLVTGITINGTDAFGLFTAENINGQDSKNPGGAFLSNVNLAASSPDAIFLMQGTFSALTPDGTGDNYRTFTGSVFGGIQTYGSFKPFSAAAELTSPNNRISKIFPSIECTAISTGGTASATGFFAYYNAAALHNGSHRNLIKAIAAYSGTNWTKGVNNGGDDLAVNNTCTTTFTITNNVSPGLWGGDVSTDWFDCNNWDDFNVPTVNTDVLITNAATRNVQIDYTSAKAALFGGTGNAKSINIIGKQLIIQHTGSTVNTLNVAGDITINANNGLDMNDGINSTIDGTINVRGNWTNNFSTGFDFGESLVNFNGSTTQTISVPDGETFYNFTNSNSALGGVQLANNNATVTVNNIFSLSNGMLAINVNTLTLNGTIIGSGSLIGSAAANLVIGGTSGGTFGTLNFLAGSRLLNNFTLNRTGAGGLCNLGTDLSINTLATISAGTLNTATNIFNGAGGLTMLGGELQLARTGITVPEFTGAYSLSGGTVNFTGAASQTIRPINYFNLTSTGASPRIMPSTGTVGIAGSFTKGASTYTFTGSTIDYNGGANQNITPFTAGASVGRTYNNLTLSNGTSQKSLTGATDVEGALTINNSITLLLGSNFLNLKSTATQTARVAPVSGTANIDYSTGIGRFVVERYFPARRAWRLITAPVSVDATKTFFNSYQVGGNNTLVGTGTYITGPFPSMANGLDVSPLNNFSLRTFNPANSQFEGVANSASTLISGTVGGAGTPDNIGYFMFVRGDRTPANANVFNPLATVNETTLRDTGKIQIQTFDFAATPSIGVNKYTLIGNPYASPVDYAALIRSGVANKFQTWDPKLNTVGGFVVVDLSFGPATIVPVGSTQTQIIQSKQAFIIETTNASSPTITFTETAKSSTNNLTLFRPANPTTQPSLAVNIHGVNASQTNLLDGVLVQFSNDFSNNNDAQDALKFTNINETFSIEHNNNFYILERRKPLNDVDTLFLNIKRTKTQAYRFNIIANKLGYNGQQGFLVDTYKGTSTPIEMEGDTWIDIDINTAEPASAAANRFIIVFKKAVEFFNVVASQQHQYVAVNWEVLEQASINSYTIERASDNQQFISIGNVAASDGNTSQIKAYQFSDVTPTPGTYFYRIKAIGANGATVYSKRVQVIIIHANSDLYVFPNPVENSQIQLYVNSKVIGKYIVKLFGENGQLVYSNTIQHSTNNARYNFTLPKTLPVGTYRLDVIDPGKKHISLSVLVK